MNSPLTENARSEKALWYQEVLSLDPASRIFSPKRAAAWRPWKCSGQA